MSLTPKQRAFADYYIETANATESAKKAGYSLKTAAAIGFENLKKPEIAAYIAEKMDSEANARIACATEVVEFYTAVMRGQVKDQFGLDASLSDRIKAGVELMKRHAINDAKKDVEKVTVIIDV